MHKGVVVWLVLLLPLANGGREIEKTRTNCPHEYSRKWVGYTSGGLCYTLVPDKKGGGRNHQRVRQKCEQMFKGGHLFYFSDTSKLPKTKWHPAAPTNMKSILSSDKSTAWEAFICVHEAYKSCVINQSVACQYDKSRGACYRNVHREVLQKEEPPFGRPCPKLKATENRAQCVCQQCETTEWSSWMIYKDPSGNVAFTRYRPPSEMPEWPCNYDTKPCCFDIKGRNENTTKMEIMNSLQCAYKAEKEANDSKSACSCPKGSTGVFCEFAYDLCERHECRNNATCENSLNDFVCICNAEYTGALCDEPKEEREQKLRKRSDGVIHLMKFYVSPAIPLVVFIILIILALAKCTRGRETRTSKISPTVSSTQRSLSTVGPFQRTTKSSQTTTATANTTSSWTIAEIGTPGAHKKDADSSYSLEDDFDSDDHISEITIHSVSSTLSDSPQNKAAGESTAEGESQANMVSLNTLAT